MTNQEIFSALAPNCPMPDRGLRAMTPRATARLAMRLERLRRTTEAMEEEAAAFSCRFPAECPFVCCSDRALS